MGSVPDEVIRQMLINLNVEVEKMHESAERMGIDGQQQSAEAYTAMALGMDRARWQVVRELEVYLPIIREEQEELSRLWIHGDDPTEL